VKFEIIGIDWGRMAVEFKLTLENGKIVYAIIPVKEIWMERKHDS